MKLLNVVPQIGGNRRYSASLRLEVVAQAMVDDCFYEELSKYRWTLDPEGYAKRSIRKETLRLHQNVWLLMGN